MSKIISFAWTTDALLQCKKTVTRRDWDDKYASRFKLARSVLHTISLPDMAAKR